MPATFSVKAGDGALDSIAVKANDAGYLSAAGIVDVTDTIFLARYGTIELGAVALAATIV